MDILLWIRPFQKTLALTPTLFPSFCQAWILWGAPYSGPRHRAVDAILREQGPHRRWVHGKGGSSNSLAKGTLQLGTNTRRELLPSQTANVLGRRARGRAPNTLSGSSRGIHREQSYFLQAWPRLEITVTHNSGKLAQADNPPAQHT